MAGKLIFTVCKEVYNTKINQIEPGSSEPKTEGTPRKSQDAQSAEAIKESLKQLTQKEG